ncbi:MAG: PEGA domain-containing protein [Kofleriaceae bacterium]
MIKSIAVAVSFVLGLQLAAAQPRPAPAPTPAPTPDTPAKPDTRTGEKAGVDETLSNGGGDERPWAKGVPPDKQRAALLAFQDGNVQLNNGLFVQAVDRYREALKSWDHPAIHYNLALALMNLDQPIEVWESLQKARQYGPGPLEKDKYEHAKDYSLLVEKQIASIEVTCQKPGAKVSVDGKEVFTAPGTYKGKVRIGKHTFVAEKPGFATPVDAPFIGPGETFRIELKLYTAEELTRYKRRWQRTWVPYAVIGAGVAAGIAGGLLELSARSSYDDFDTRVARCNEAAGGNAGCDITTPGLTDLRDSGDTKRMLGYIGYGVAGGAIATGIVLAYLNRSRAYQISTDEYRMEQLRNTNVSVTPLVVPGAAGAIITGQF